MENCIFCKIIKKEIPAEIVYEDENFLAFLDIRPVSHGHILIIPKEHILWMQDASDDIISKIFLLTKKIMTAMQKGLPCDYVLESVAGNEVPHFHIHLIPRYFNDGLQEFPRIDYEDDVHQSKIKEKITGALARP
jgi:histidine triad (HIT) family protein